MLPVTYTFEPGEPGDGVTVHIPLAVLNRVAAHGFDWQVPGFREELVGALVRSLPKQYRRLLIPIAERAREAFEQVDPAGGALVDELARVVSDLAGERIPPSAFDVARVPDHLRISFAVEDADGAPGRARQGPRGAPHPVQQPDAGGDRRDGAGSRARPGFARGTSPPCRGSSRRSGTAMPCAVTPPCSTTATACRSGC